MKNKISLLSILLLLIISCSNIIERTNYSDDIEAGKKIAEEFLEKIKTQDYNSAFNLMDSTTIKREEFISFAEKVFLKTGRIKSYQFDNVMSIVKITNGIYSGGMDIVYKLENDSTPSEVKLAIEYKFENKLIIIGYTPSIDLIN